MKSAEVKLVRLPFLLPRWAVAQVLVPGRIFVRRDVRVSRRLLAHELVHVQQLRSMGLLRYWWTYLTLLLRFGYHEHPLELDAIVRAAEPSFLEWADQLLEPAERKRKVSRRLASGRPADLG